MQAGGQSKLQEKKNSKTERDNFISALKKGSRRVRIL